MANPIRVGIIICDRYRACAGGKCLRALRNREGAFSVRGTRRRARGLHDLRRDAPAATSSTRPEEMKKNGADVIHLATGPSSAILRVRIDAFKTCITER